MDNPPERSTDPVQIYQTVNVTWPSPAAEGVVSGFYYLLIG